MYMYVSQHHMVQSLCFRSIQQRSTRSGRSERGLLFCLDFKRRRAPIDDCFETSPVQTSSFHSFNCANILSAHMFVLIFHIIAFNVSSAIQKLLDWPVSQRSIFSSFKRVLPLSSHHPVIARAFSVLSYSDNDYSI